jgi:hypothetical protein
MMSSCSDSAANKIGDCGYSYDDLMSGGGMNPPSDGHRFSYSHQIPSESFWKQDSDTMIQ